MSELESAPDYSSASDENLAGIPQEATLVQPTVEIVEEAMKDVIDPELGINVVDLGLVYDIHLEGDEAVIDMTLTSAACPLTDVLEDQTMKALQGIVRSSRINWVWLPPWGPERITSDGREMLQALGFNV